MKTPCLLLSALLLAPALLRAQGTFPPEFGPTVPTMKTLTQIEPRTPIASAPFTISASGSYYLTGNLTVTTGTAITISADQVTLDLNGFTISSSASPASGTAVLLTSVRTNVTIKNGHLRGTTTFAAAAFTPGGFLDGVANNTSLSANLRVTDLNIVGMASDGINLVTSAVSTFVVERCNVTRCASIGILAGVVRDCTADTTGSSAILADIATNCHGETVNTDLVSALGVRGTSSVENCRGISVSGVGVSGTNVSNSRGSSTSGTGLLATNAINCEGASTSGQAGLDAGAGTASFSRGRRDGGVAISAFNAIGCTVLGSGTVTASNKSLGTP